MAIQDVTTPVITVRYMTVQQLHVGSDSHVQAPDRCTISALDRCRITAGDFATVTCREGCHISSGDFSCIDAGAYTIVRVGDDSSVIVGENSVVAAGIGSTVVFRIWIGDSEEQISFTVGELGIRPGATYSIRAGTVTCIQ